MKNRPAYSLSGLIRIHNLILCVWSLAMCVGAIIGVVELYQVFCFFFSVLFLLSIIIIVYTLEDLCSHSYRFMVCGLFFVDRLRMNMLCTGFCITGHTGTICRSIMSFWIPLYLYLIDIIN